MFNTLSAITGLWSARATKVVLCALVFLGVYVYVSSLRGEIDNQRLTIANKDHQIAAKQLQINSLTIGIEQANKATESALKEVRERERLSLKRIGEISALRDKLSDAELTLFTLEQSDEHVKSWADEPIPDGIVRLLNNVRASDRHCYSSSEGVSTDSAYASVSRSDNECQDQ